MNPCNNAMPLRPAWKSRLSSSQPAKHPTIRLQRKKLFFCLALFGVPLLLGESAVVVLYAALVIAATVVAEKRLLPVMLCAMLLKNISPNNLYGFSPNVILWITVCNLGILFIAGLRLFVRRGKIRSGGMGVFAVFIVFTFFTSLLGRDPEVSFLKLFNLLVMVIPCSLYFAKIKIDDEIIGDLLHICTAILLLSLAVVFRPNSWLSNFRTFPLFHGVMGHPQTFGIILAFFMSFLCSLRFFMKARIHRREITLILLLCVVELLLSQCRTAILALVFGLGAGVWLSNKNGGRNVMKYAVTLLLLLWGLLQMVPQTRQLLLKVQNADTKEITMESMIETRMLRMGPSWKNFKSSPLLGIGFGMPSVVEEWTYRYATIFGMRLLVSVPAEKGNMFSALLEECGILGTILFCLWLVQILVRCRRTECAYFLFCPMVVLFLNFGEYSLISLGGQGLLMWIFLLLGFQSAFDGGATAASGASTETRRSAAAKFGCRIARGNGEGHFGFFRVPGSAAGFTSGDHTCPDRHEYGI